MHTRFHFSILRLLLFVFFLELRIIFIEKTAKRIPKKKHSIQECANKEASVFFVPHTFLRTMNFFPWMRRKMFKNILNFSQKKKITEASVCKEKAFLLRFHSRKHKLEKKATHFVLSGLDFTNDLFYEFHNLMLSNNRVCTIFFNDYHHYCA